MMSRESHPSDSEVPSPEVTIDLLAGRHPSGEWVFERLLVAREAAANTYRVLKSPVFVRGIARGDTIQQLDQPQGAFTVVRHGGNLCIRVFSRRDFDDPAMQALRQTLVAEIEKLGGDLDISEANVLVFSIHVGCGFAAIEALLDQHLQSEAETNWVYGNVYDPESGEPLDWWQAFFSSD